RFQSTTRRSASRTSPARGRCSAGSPRSRSTRGCGGCSLQKAGSRYVLRRVAITAAIVLVAAGFVVPASGGSRHILVGLYDAAQVLGYPARTFPLLRHLKVQIVRISLPWGGSPWDARSRTM